MKASGHKDRFNKITIWVNEKEAYLKTVEKVDNTPEAALQVWNKMNSMLVCESILCPVSIRHL